MATHPGTIAFLDERNGRSWTVGADTVPPSVSWVVDGKGEHPVVRVVLSQGADGPMLRLEGPEGEFLKSVQGRVPSPRPSRP